MDSYRFGDDQDSIDGRARLSGNLSLARPASAALEDAEPVQNKRRRLENGPQSFRQPSTTQARGMAYSSSTPMAPPCARPSRRSGQRRIPRQYDHSSSRRQPPRMGHPNNSGITSHNPQYLLSASFVNSVINANTNPLSRPRFPSLITAGFSQSGLLHRHNIPSIKAFYPGLLIRCSHHVTAQNPKADPEHDSNFVQTNNARVCSKFRYAVVLWVHSDGSIFVLPVSTHENNGLEKLPSAHLKFHLTVQGSSDAVNEETLSIRSMFGRNQIKGTSSVCLTGGFTIKHNEYVVRAGSLTRRSTQRVLTKYEQYAEEARDQSWEQR